MLSSSGVHSSVACFGIYSNVGMSTMILPFYVKSFRSTTDNSSKIIHLYSSSLPEHLCYMSRIEDEGSIEKQISLHEKNCGLALAPRHRIIQR